MDTPLTLRKLLEACLLGAGVYTILAFFGLFWLMHELSGETWPKWLGAIRRWIKHRQDKYDHETITKLDL